MFQKRLNFTYTIKRKKTQTSATITKKVLQAIEGNIQRLQNAYLHVF